MLLELFAGEGDENTNQTVRIIRNIVPNVFIQRERPAITELNEGTNTNAEESYINRKEKKGDQR
jgi:hypothetical protein